MGFRNTTNGNVIFKKPGRFSGLAMSVHQTGYITGMNIDYVLFTLLS